MDQAMAAKGPEIDLDCTRSDMQVDVILPICLGVATDRGLGGFNHTKFPPFHKPSLGYLFFFERHIFFMHHLMANALLV